MSAIQVEVTFNDGQEYTLRRPMDHGVAKALRARSLEREHDFVEDYVFQALVAAGLGKRGELATFANRWSVHIVDDEPDDLFKVRFPEAGKPHHRRVTKCRSILEVANRLLPRDTRDETLDEWMDEIEAAAERDLPVFGRVVSILFRALPVMAWRSRLPTRARGGGS